MLLLISFITVFRLNWIINNSKENITKESKIVDFASFKAEDAIKTRIDNNIKLFFNRQFK